VAGLDLLSDKRLRGCNENDLSRRKPTINWEWELAPGKMQVIRDVQFSITEPAIKVFPRPVGRETRVFSNKHLRTILNW
jgi:hypothetical protein